MESIFLVHTQRTIKTEGMQIASSHCEPPSFERMAFIFRKPVPYGYRSALHVSIGLLVQYPLKGVKGAWDHCVVLGFLPQVHVSGTSFAPVVVLTTGARKGKYIFTGGCYIKEVSTLSAKNRLQPQLFFKALGRNCQETTLEVFKGKSKLAKIAIRVGLGGTSEAKEQLRMCSGHSSRTPIPLPRDKNVRNSVSSSTSVEQ